MMAKAKPLKEQNRPYLRGILGANVLAFYCVSQGRFIQAEDWIALLHAIPKAACLGAFAFVVAIVLNGQLSSVVKDRLVFWRWQFPLPGHRAYSFYALHDPRIDLVRLTELNGGSLPTDPKDQGTTWFRMFKSVEDEPAVLQVHRDYLLARDYTGMSAIFFVVFGTSSCWLATPLRWAAAYLACLMIQYALARRAAANFGVRFVTTVMAQKSAADGTTKRQRRKSPR